MQKITLFLHTRVEEVTGVLSGSIMGVIVHRTFADILTTLLIAFITGFLGAAGAYLFKTISKSLRSLYNKVRNKG